MSEAPCGLAAEPREELAAALDRFTIHSFWTFEFDHEPIVDVRMAPPVPMLEGDHAPLLRAIQATFYDRCYARRSARAASMPSPEPDFVRCLGAANTSRDRWDK